MNSTKNLVEEVASQHAGRKLELSGISLHYHTYRIFHKTEEKDWIWLKIYYPEIIEFGGSFEEIHSNVGTGTFLSIDKDTYIIREENPSGYLLTWQTSAIVATPEGEFHLQERQLTDPDMNVITTVEYRIKLKA